MKIFLPNCELGPLINCLNIMLLIQYCLLQYDYTERVISSRRIFIAKLNTIDARGNTIRK